MNINEQANFIWSIADLLRGDFKQSEYGKVILPFTVLRRFDCVLAPSKAKILEANKTLTVSNKRPIFKRMTGHDYYNVSQFDFEKLMDDSNAIEANLRDYINGFSEDVREIIDNFEIFGVIDRLSRANLLYLVVQRFAEIDMSDTQIDNLEMGYMFEELIRRFSEQSNETAGEHFTPREVIELMVVTGSRLHAVRYYQEFQRYIKKMGYENALGILIAFSGTVHDGGEEYTEVSLNGIKESELPEKFHSGEYQVLLVAEKYQTGFDEPLLHTMFVDKKLSGVKAVQTLSRLNRTCFGKDDTFVLDFVNSAEDIRAAFAPYYEETSIEETTDANIVYELKSKLDEFRVYWQSEIEAFSKAFFKPTKKQGNMDFGVLNSFLDPAVDRYNGLDENEQEEFKSTLAKFVRTYTFLTNIIRLDDADLHKFHAYAKFLQKKLPKREGGGPIFLDDEVSLQYYRVQKIFEGSIALEQSEPLPNKLHPGKPKPEEEKAPLSELIDKINEKFGTEFTNIDKVLEQIVSDMDANEELRVQARNNSQEHFRFPFNDAFMDVVIGRMAQNQQFCERVLDDAKFGDTVRDLLVGVVYERLRSTTGSGIHP